MNINPIRTEHDYKAALREVSRLIDLDPEVESEEGGRLEILSTLIEAYEQKTFPIELPSPAEAIKFRMEQGGFTPKDLVPSIGKINRVYEVLNGTRRPTIDMIRNLYANFGIPVESLIGKTVEIRTVRVRGFKKKKNQTGALAIATEARPNIA